MSGRPATSPPTPDQKLALVANSLRSVPDGTGWKAVPSDEVFVVDLWSAMPRLVTDVSVGERFLRL